MAHAEAQVHPSLAAGANNPAAKIAYGAAHRRPFGNFAARSSGYNDSLNHIGPSARHGYRGFKEFDPSI
jgi:hypothetical protein